MRKTKISKANAAIIKKYRGKVEETHRMHACDDDWIRAGRLQEQASNGDKEAQKKLDEMKSSSLVKLRK